MGRMACEGVEHRGRRLDAAGFRARGGVPKTGTVPLVDNSYDEFSMLRRAAKKKGEALLPLEGRDQERGGRGRKRKQPWQRRNRRGGKGGSHMKPPVTQEQAAEEVVASRKGKSQTIDADQSP